MQEFKAKDRVRLRSGSPVMEVKGMSEKRPGSVRLVWAEGETTHRGVLPAAMLELEGSPPG